jgi:tetratricopeptide (TPR) repeat protein
MEKYPLDHELRQLRQEMALRAKVDADEAEDRKRARQRWVQRFAIRLAVLVALAGLVFFGLRSYSNWFQRQWQVAQQKLEQEVRLTNLALKFANAQELLRAGRPEDARPLLEDLQAADPNYPGLAEAMAELERQSALENGYAEANRLLQAGDLPAALAAFEAIEAQEPYYMDVAIQIKTIKDQFQLGDFFTRAEEAYQAGQWELAISRFEDVRRIDPNFQETAVEERLYESYIEAAEELLAGQPESLQALKQAEEFFQKGLALRPQDEATRLKRAEALDTLEDRLVSSYVDQAQAAVAGQADSLQALEAAHGYLLKALEIRPDDEGLKLQIQLAEMYLIAQDEFEKSDWDAAISNLEFVYGLEPGYASGTARQTLYEAYIARGDAQLASGSLDTALGDYQRAAVLGEDSPDFTEVLLYEARIKVAYLQGLLGNYEEAARIYLAAVEGIKLEVELAQEEPNLALKLRDAIAYLERRNFRNAYKLFKDVSAYTPKYTLMAYEVQEGEYLTQIANRYGTTLGAIIKVNEDVARRDSLKGLTILIPVRGGTHEVEIPTPTPGP